MKEWFKKHTIKILIVFCAALLILIGVAVGINLSNKMNAEKQNDNKVTYEFKHYEHEVANLNNHDDVGVMIMDCDSKDSFLTVNNANFTSRENQYVQGTGAMDLINMRYTYVNPSASFQPIDISAYSKGSIHISLYINDPKYLGNQPLNIELTSAGKADTAELEWNISPNVLKKGWNELYLGMDDAGRHGTPDLTAINFFRSHALRCRMGVEVYLDAVYATNTPGMDLNGPKEYATTKPGYLLDFDTLQGLKTYQGKLSLAHKQVGNKEGVAAVTVKNPTAMWIMADIEPTDVSQYDKISFWMHIDNAAHVRDGQIVVEMTSSGKYDAEELNWTIAGASLKKGWNEVTLGFGAASSVGIIDLTKVNYFRVYPMNCSEEITITFDAVKLLQANVRVAEDGMIADFDTVKPFLKVGGSITTVSGEYKQGTGALKYTIVNSDQKPKVATWTAALDDRVDVSKYADGGISFWLYIDDVAKFNGVHYEIRSGSTFDVDEYEWQIPGLKNGWNEVRLAFKDAKVTGNPDLSRIYTMRIIGTSSADATIIIDAIQAVEDASEKTPDGTTDDAVVPGMIFSGDSFKYIEMKSSGRNEITRKEGEYLQGTGAYKSIGAGQIRFKGKLRETKDLSAYQNGGIQFSLYIEDKSKLEANLMYFELTSGGIEDVDELEWRIDLTPYQNGWNTVTLKFDNVTKRTGEIDFSNVNYLRIFLNRVEQNPDLVLIIDDVHAIESTALVPIDGIIADCDTLLSPFRPGYVAGSITNKKNEYKEGTGAIKLACKNSVWWVAAFEDVMDVSKYAEGGISFWLYVDDASKIRTPLKFEFRSGDTYDKDEYEWQISELKDGWNKVKLSFDKASVSGTPDITKLCAMRLFGGNLNGEVTLIIDEIRAVESIVDDGTEEQPDDHPQEKDNELTPGETDEHSDKEWSPFI